jgi:probable addiction module antidote protein
VTPRTSRFGAADCLDTEDRQVDYSSAALETGDADFVRDALGLVARARGMSEIARIAGSNRESPYKALGESGNPEFGAVMRVVRALGLTLTARPTAPARTSAALAPDPSPIPRQARDEKEGSQGHAASNPLSAATNASGWSIIT